MSTLHRLKAYFGMVPADELDDYGPDEYDTEHTPGHIADREASYRSHASARSSRWTGADSGAGLARDYDDDYYDDEVEAQAPRSAPVRRPWAPDTSVRGSLAVEQAAPAPVVQPAARATAPPVEEPHPMSRITTLHPRSYNEARSIGEHYRDGIPVIMNLTAMDDADAKRLVDFAAGLAFALRGSIDKVTTKVFLISPANVDVTAEDKRRIAEGSFLPTHFKHG